MKTKNTPEVTSSDPVHITIPTGWDRITVPQFKTICTLLSADINASSLPTLLLLRLGNLSYIGRPAAAGTAAGDPAGAIGLYRHGKKIHLIADADIAAGTAAVDWIHGPAIRLLSRPDLLRSIHKSARHPQLHDLTFAQWLRLDTLYSNITTRTGTRAATETATDRIIRTLWPRIRNIRPWHTAAAILWMTAVSEHHTATYPHLYTPTQPDQGDIFGASRPRDPRETINAQIRALTKGDITAETRVLETPMPRAMTELDQLAREYAELKALQKQG